MTRESAKQHRLVLPATPAIIVLTWAVTQGLAVATAPAELVQRFWPVLVAANLMTLGAVAVFARHVPASNSAAVNLLLHRRGRAAAQPALGVAVGGPCDGMQWTFSPGQLPAPECVWLDVGQGRHAYGLISSRIAAAPTAGWDLAYHLRPTAPTASHGKP